MFCLFYNASTKKVHALNGSGRAPADLTIDGLRKELDMKAGQPGKIPADSVHSITVPGAPAGWVDTVEKFGSKKLSMEQILMPAIELGEKGYPVSEYASHLVSSHWPRNASQQTDQSCVAVGDQRAQASTC